MFTIQYNFRPATGKSNYLKQMFANCTLAEFFTDLKISKPIPVDLVPFVEVNGRQACVDWDYQLTEDTRVTFWNRESYYGGIGLKMLMALREAYETGVEFEEYNQYMWNRSVFLTDYSQFVDKMFTNAKVTTRYGKELMNYMTWITKPLKITENCSAEPDDVVDDSEYEADEVVDDSDCELLG